MFRINSILSKKSAYIIFEMILAISCLLIFSLIILTAARSCSLNISKGQYFDRLCQILNDRQTYLQTASYSEAKLPYEADGFRIVCADEKIFSDYIKLTYNVFSDTGKVYEFSYYQPK